MDRIVRGSEGGHYFVLLGPKVRFYSSNCMSVLYEEASLGHRQDDNVVRGDAGNPCRRRVNMRSAS